MFVIEFGLNDFNTSTIRFLLFAINSKCSVKNSVASRMNRRSRKVAVLLC